jgi:hypothetical protein
MCCQGACSDPGEESLLSESVILPGQNNSLLNHDLVRFSVAQGAPSVQVERA